MRSLAVQPWRKLASQPERALKRQKHSQHAPRSISPLYHHHSTSSFHIPQSGRHFQGQRTWRSILDRQSPIITTMKNDQSTLATMTHTTNTMTLMTIEHELAQEPTQIERWIHLL